MELDIHELVNGAWAPYQCAPWTRPNKRSVLASRLVLWGGRGCALLCISARGDESRVLQGALKEWRSYKHKVS